MFISGYTIDSDKNRALFGEVHTKVFLSRSPCLEPTDAKLVSVIGSKPKEMSKDDWDMLCCYEFGTIIFPLSKKGSTPLPCMIAGMKLKDMCIFVSSFLTRLSCTCIIYCEWQMVILTVMVREICHTDSFVSLSPLF